MGLTAVLVTLYNDWAIQSVVLVSLAAHVALSLFASVRRRQGPGLATLILWLAYQLADWATPFVLNKLSARTLPQEQQLVALWVPFLLTHLAGPDNIAAYGLEDDKLSSRKNFSTVTIILHAVWASFAIYKQLLAGGGDRTLLWASLAMGGVAVAKCWLKVTALREGGFGKMSSATRGCQPDGVISDIHQALYAGHWGRHRHRRSQSQSQPLSDEKALLVAHRLLHMTKGSFADFPVVHTDRLRENAKELFLFHDTVGWLNLCKVVEMEVSLMYDILYTKAAAIHRWWGYLVCAASPVATATAAVLFWSYRRNQNQAVVLVHRERVADVWITYSLVAVTFILDVRWLLRAAASTWAYAYAFFGADDGSRSPPGRWTCWLRHHVFYSGRWHRFRRALVSLDRPRQLLLLRGRSKILFQLFQNPKSTAPAEPIRGGSYRLWSGNLGSYNLLDDCTDQYKPNPLSKLVKKCTDEDTWMEYEYSSWRRFQLGEGSSPQNSIRKVLFDQIRKTLEKAYPRDMTDMTRDDPGPPWWLQIPPDPVLQQHATAYWELPYSDYLLGNNLGPYHPYRLGGERRIKEVRNLDYALGFVPDLQEAILVLHVATDVFFLLSSSNNQQQVTPEQKRYKKVIQVVSNYMAFLAAARPDMVPGLNMHSLYYFTRTSLVEIRELMEEEERHGRRSSTKDKQHDLAGFLLKMESDTEPAPDGSSKLYSKSSTLSDGIFLAHVLLLLLNGFGSDNIDWMMHSRPNSSQKRIKFLLGEIGAPGAGTGSSHDGQATMVGQELPDWSIHQPPSRMDILLKEILEMWVRLLIFVSTRCGRDSHAKQLARGCELTTIVWILVDHAAIFRISS